MPISDLPPGKLQEIVRGLMPCVGGEPRAVGLAIDHPEQVFRQVQLVGWLVRRYDGANVHANYA